MKYEHILTKEILENSYQELQSLKAVGRKFSVSADTIKDYMIFYNLNYKKQVKHTCNQTIEECMKFTEEDVIRSPYSGLFMHALEKHERSSAKAKVLAREEAKNVENAEFNAEFNEWHYGRY